MKLLRKNWLCVRAGTVSFLLVIFLMSCSREKQEADVSEAHGTPVRVTHPRITDFARTIDLNANTLFLTKETVRATFQGFIEKEYKHVGDKVAASDPLFLIRTKESSANDSLGIKLGNARFSGSIAVQAKTDGVLTTLNYNTGDFVSEGEAIAVISNPSSLRIVLNVPYQYVSGIKPNKPCHLYLPDGRILPAFIQEGLPSVDPVSQTQTFLLRVKDDVSLPENLNLTVRVPLQAVKGAMGVPKSALMSDETQETFWIMKLLDDSMAIRVDVQKGIENDSLVQITNSTLSADDRIVSTGAYGLPDTAKVFTGGQ
jgi:multidrug efflux pump subunit AcrA (membrane-fusion protein)